jgi:two-component sensor histidine kinase
VIHELVINTVKYAISDRATGSISVRITRVDDLIHFDFRDDGPGYPDDVLRLENYHLGFALIQKIVQEDLHGELTLYNDNGAVTIIRFKAMEESKQNNFLL